MHKILLSCETIQKYVSAVRTHEKLSLTNPQFIEIPSLALSPVAPVLLSLSEPAKSTKWNLADSISQSAISVDDDGPFSIVYNNSRTNQSTQTAITMETQTAITMETANHHHGNTDSHCHGNSQPSPLKQIAIAMETVITMETQTDITMKT